jgi:hypothetical protein
MGERSRFRYWVHLRFDSMHPHLVQRLRGVVAKIKNHLLQLCRLTGYDGCVRYLADRQFDPRSRPAMTYSPSDSGAAKRYWWSTVQASGCSPMKKCLQRSDMSRSASPVRGMRERRAERYRKGSTHYWWAISRQSGAPGVPILLATASADEIGADTLVAAGIFAVVHRPLVSAELASALARCLTGSRFTPVSYPCNAFLQY